MATTDTGTTDSSGLPQVPPVPPAAPALVTTNPVAPQPKKFSSVNINKKFLEKNTTPSTPGSTTSPSSTTAKPASRPQLTPSSTHGSRLIAAKLTATPQPTTTTGPGWSRPSSAAPSAPITNGTSAPPSLKTGGPPSVPHMGKVIHPQPRSSAQQAPNDVSQGSKPAWRKVDGAPRSLSRDQADFPTAAEAQINRASNVPLSPSASPSAAQQVSAEEADTFRGVHLDPNAHHWDEMEEDDNFLDSVVEFEDGRRYEVEAPTTDAASTQSGLREGLPPDPSSSKHDRFADDFDRSWPRSASSAASPVSPSTPIHATAAERVLFNERSNRLEPYNNHRPGQGPPKRNSVEGLPGGANVQVLQKFERDRPRPLANGAPQREFQRRDSGHGPHPGRPFGTPPLGGRPFVPAPPMQPHEPRGRRTSNMGPPPVPPHATSRSSFSRDGPPPFSRDGPQFGRDSSTGRGSQRAPSVRATSRESRTSLRAPSSPAYSTRSNASPSPVLLKAAAVHGIAPPSIPPVPEGVNMDEMRKDVMHSAAERAKQRRLQEEAERDKERERAKLKAAELEARLKKAEPPKEPPREPANESEVKKIEPTLEKVTPVVEPSKVPEASPVTTPLSATFPSTAPRRPSVTIATRPTSFTERPPAPRRGSTTYPVTQSETVNSWRSHATPLAPRPPPAAESARTARPRKPSVTLTPQVIFEQAPTMKDEPVETNLEEVDFHDLSNFVGADPKHDESSPVANAEDSGAVSPSGSHPAVAKIILTPPPPARQSELAVELSSQGTASLPLKSPAATLPSPPAPSDVSSWRRKEIPPSSVPDQTRAVFSTPAPVVAPIPAAPAARPSPPEPRHSAEHAMSPPRATSRPHKEPTASAFEETMSRIKGAMGQARQRENMERQQVFTPSRAPASPPVYTPAPPGNRTNRERWVSPAFRPQTHSEFDIPQEPFTTMPEPPQSPKPAWNTFNIRIPKESVRLDPIPRKQITAATKPGMMRWDILSFDPPLDKMAKKNISVNQVLFDYNTNYKGKLKYNVSLPKRGWDQLALSHHTPDSSPQGSHVVQSVPPSAPALSVTTVEPLSPPRANKAQPKMPVGSAVAFIRDDKLVNAEEASKPAVNFIVGSELDGGLDNGSRNEYVGVPATPVKDVIGATEASSASSEMPSIQPSPWLRPMSNGKKDSPSRGPDPEHLKALWSSTAPTSELPAVNSLEGIADDLSSVPFSIQDVKSEDGETPPPTMASNPPSRMSLHDVTRAFQQVPPSASTTPHRPPISPPTTNAPVARPPPNFSHGHQQQHSGQGNPSMRPQYNSFATAPSPMMSPSPAPMMYSPLPMNNALPRMPGPNAPPPPQHMYPAPPGPQPWGAQPQLMRGPYPGPQMVTYSPSAQPMYLPSPQMGNGAGRGRGGMIAMSPGMVHASPHMYNAQAMMPPRPPQSHPPPTQYVPPQAYMRPGW
ncbi:hypothetical protein CYLTODRAFT_488747 [Cylindrobasidium torrendii FP15055 ss-10]|uniref:Uncharacterized protein n=1 Tax=Cylindrobasidium torrendii FP15055 ss-10 TaxID=1314674 RepID=A0A0D7BGL3_9AGAR|nr:hypothetical protein CYLTODRAFT_488747 [Cylindrobasidium torrendii FP15055 ss-10]